MNTFAKNYNVATELAYLNRQVAKMNAAPNDFCRQCYQDTVTLWKERFINAGYELRGQVNGDLHSPVIAYSLVKEN